jgi:hypothetical protein
MTTGSITINPALTQNALGSFNIESTGYIQGQALDQPSIRNSLAGGILGDSETLPMWGGVGISEAVPAGIGSGTIPETGHSSTLGGQITRATTLTAGAGCMTGISVFDQNYSAVSSPESPVPLSAPSMQVNFYRFGSGARIAVAVAAGLVDLRGAIITSQVSWDFTNQLLIPYSATYAADTITGAVWANTAGGQTTFTVSSDLTADINAGDVIEVTGVVSTGAAGVFNGEFVVVSITSTTIVVVQLAAANPGTYSSGGSVGAGGGALPVRVLDVSIGNSMTVNYDPVTGFATWNRQGDVAIILI